jgi:hypothetical protein
VKKRQRPPRTILGRFDATNPSGASTMRVAPLHLVERGFCRCGRMTMRVAATTPQRWGTTDNLTSCRRGSGCRKLEVGS